MVDLARKILLHDRTRFLITVSGVAFAVTLVFVQVGLFQGLLSNASVTIERSDADLWVTARTPRTSTSRTPSPRPTSRRPLDPRRGAGRQPARLVRGVALPTGATENAVIYALEDFIAGGCPGGSVGETPATEAAST